MMVTMLILIRCCGAISLSNNPPGNEKNTKTHNEISLVGTPKYTFYSSLNILHVVRTHSVLKTKTEYAYIINTTTLQGSLTVHVRYAHICIIIILCTIKL